MGATFSHEENDTNITKVGRS